MKAIYFSEFGGPEVLQIGELPLPAIYHTDVLVKTQWVGINFADIYRRKGEYAVSGEKPYVLGYEGSGIVEKVGSQVTRFQVGDRVAFVDVARANAEFVSCPESKLIAVPVEISLELAASSLLQGLTAQILSSESHTLAKDEKVLLHAGASGVGLLLIQMAKQVGAEVTALVSSSEKAQAALEVGAFRALVVDSKTWVQKAKEVCPEGYDVVYDSVGTTLNESIDLTRARGKIIYYGWAGGVPPLLSPQVFMNQSKTLIGMDLWNYIPDQKSLEIRVKNLFSSLLENRLKVKIEKKFKFEEAIQAHQFIESRSGIGKSLFFW